MNKKIDWVIHLVANGTCNECGRTEEGFLPYTCNAHTHGLAAYGHMDLQLVLFYSSHEIARLLNTLGLRIQAGEHFEPGALVSGIYEDCDVRLDVFEESGRNVLRVIIPDRHGRFPENPQCAAPYRLQSMKTVELIVKEGTPS